MTKIRLLIIIIVFLIVLQPLYSVFHKVGGINMQGNISDMEIINNLAYISGYGNELMIFDISCLSNPELVSSITLNGLPYNLEIYENYCFVHIDDYTIAIIDISDIHNPNIISEFSFSSLDIRKFCIYDETVYIALENELQIIDINNPQNPLLLSSCAIPVTPSSIKSLAIKNNLALVGTYDGLYIYDITDRLNPFLITLYEISHVYDIEINDNDVYLSYTYGLQIINIDNHASIQVIGEFDQFRLYDLHIDDNYLYANAGSYSYVKFYLFDISDLTDIQIIGSYAEAGSIVAGKDLIVYFITHPYNQANCTFVDVSDAENQYYIGDSYYQCNRRDIDTNNDLLGVCSSENSGINFFDISNPYEPELVYQTSFGYNMELYASTITVCDNFAISGFSGSYYENSVFLIHDISDPANIIQLSITDVDAPPFDSIYKIAVKDNYAYIGCAGELQIFDISDLTDPFYMCSFDTGFVMDLVIRGDLIHLVDIGGLKLIDISNPESPELLGSWESNNRAEGVNVFDRYAYVSDKSGGVKIIDITIPTNPFLVSTILPHYDSVIYSTPVIQNGKLIISDICWNELLVYDLSNPAFPTLINSFKWNLPSYEISATDEYLITANGSSGFTILDLVDLTPLSQNVIYSKDCFLNNYPNPFNPETTISFNLTEENAENAEIIIYNIKGQKVKQIVCGQLSAGQHSVTWNGKDSNEKPVSSGIYFYRLRTNGYDKTKRMLLLK